ncbi:MAG TPA: hypothetical protein VES79_02455 [Solirubrobacteraceae bacterium]|nr:hypothetical protein [Solirubrobacteraceae bacterium]
MTVVRRRRSACALAVLALGAAGCGSDSRHARTPPPPKSAATPAASKPASNADDAVIRGWADALRGGHVARASRYFALPSVVSNGTPAIRLTSRRDVEFFNRTLPCGARVKRTEDTGAFVVATFELTERPGRGRCGQGVGGIARTAFLIRGGKIRQWRRVVEEEPVGSRPPSV